jgi:uncharacterized damage-inducible protein DinB
MITELLGQLWHSNQQAVLGPVQKLTAETYRNRLTPNTASAGFIALHTAEGMHGFAAMIFGRPMSVVPQASRGATDTGQMLDLAQIQQLMADSFTMVAEQIAQTTDEQWAEVITSPMGERSRQQMLAFLMHHNSYHAGQIVQAMKKGQRYEAEPAAN